MKFDSQIPSKYVCGAVCEWSNRLDPEAGTGLSAELGLKREVPTVHRRTKTGRMCDWHLGWRPGVEVGQCYVSRGTIPHAQGMHLT